MAIERAIVIAKMRGAFKSGLSASKFLLNMKAEGLSYRRSDMLSDWRSENQLETKKGLMQFVRRDYFPTEKTIASVDYAMSKEYMYKVRTMTRIKAGEPLKERFVNIMSDIPMTPRQLESEVQERWGEWEKYQAEELVGIQAWSAVHKVME